MINTQRVASRIGVSVSRIGITRVVLGVTVSSCGLWALRPLPPVAPPELDASPDRAVQNRQPSEPTPFDMAAFSVPLWLVPPVPHNSPLSTPSPALPSPPPIPLVLLAIIQEDAHFRAVLYDPREDRITVISQGQTIEALMVTRIDSATIDLRDQMGTRTLALHSAHAGGAP
jgi:hypothetical protein